MRFKRIAALLLAAVMLFCFAACENKEKPGPAVPPEPDKPDVPEPAALHMTLDEWPVIDGALAMIPYYEELAARVLDMPIDEARKYVLANNTPQAYKNLAEGTVDMVFCAPPSAEQIAYCREKGVELDHEQVLNSGFVFFVNKNNPVDNLSSQQLHDIYAGKLTNWKELGGKDEPIIPYQRAEGSGSQTGLYEHVIPQYELMKPPIEQKLGGMAEIIDAVANYDNASGALGFSYYYYVTNMHYQDDVKLIAVDNVYPTAETITSDMYPFISKTSVFFDKSQPEDSPVRKLASWCRGDGGVKLAQDLGYVPSGDAATVIAGYGEAIKNKQPQLIAYANNFPYAENENPDSYYGHHNEPVYYGIKNKLVADKINADIHEIFTELFTEDHMPPFRGMSRYEGVECEDCSVWFNEYGNFNNILSFSIWMNKTYVIDEYYYYVSDVVTRNYDLNTGRQLQLSDLFDDKENGFKFLNTKVYDAINNIAVDAEEGYFGYDEAPLKLAAPFKGIKDDQKFVINSGGYITLYFDYDTPEFYLNGQPATLTIPASNYTNMSKLMSTQSLFEDEAVHPYLLYQNDYDKEVRVEKEDQDFRALQGDYNINMHATYLFYEDMTDYQKQLCQGNQELFEQHVAAAKESIDQLEADGYKDLGAYITESVVASQIGGYVTVSENISYSVYAPGLYANIYEDSNKLHTFRAGSDEELIFHDVFKEGADIKSVLMDALLEKAAYINADGINFWDLTGSDAFISAAVDSIRSFGLTDTSLQLQFDDMESLFRRFLPQLRDSFYSYVESMLEYVNYSDIGYENLAIFQ